MDAIRTKRLHFAVLAMVAGLLVAVEPAWAGANLVAIGQYSEMPFARAEGHISLAGKEVVYTFDDPTLDFGRVVVRSTDALSVVRRDLFVGYTGAGLTVDTRGAGGSAAKVSDVEFWLRIEGSIIGGHKYEWEFEGGGEKEDTAPFPAIIPMLWADGEPIGAEVTVGTPVPEDTDRIQRMIIPRGIVSVPSFEHQTGAAWIVLKPRQYGNVFTVRRLSLREVENNPESAGAGRMPIPVRYVPIKSALEDQISEVFDRTPTVLKRLQRENGAFADGEGEEVVRLTASLAGAIGVVDPDAEQVAKACEWLAQQSPPAGQSWSLDTVASRLSFLASFGDRDKYGPIMQRDAVSLAQAQRKDGGWPAGQSQESPSRASVAAPESNHLATITAMAALAQARAAGAEPDDRVWKQAMSYWTEAQSYGGGFTDRLSRYGGVGQVTSTGYTALGAGSLLLAVDMAAGMGARRCGTYLASTQQLRAVDAAFAWLDKYYANEQHESGSLAGGYNPYIKPIGSIFLGAVSGMTHFDGQDIWREAASELMQHYDRATSMFGVRGPQGFAVQPSPLLTAVALNDLATAAAPTVCQRIVVGDDSKGWAQYSPDVPHLVSHMAQERRLGLHWRRASIDDELRDLSEVPITVLRVLGDFAWTPEQWKKLRDYCMVGGTVLIDVAPDAKSAREKLKSDLATAFAEYKLAEIPPEDSLLSASGKKVEVPGLEGVSNGFRYLVLVPSDSWSCEWQISDGKKEVPSFAFMDGLLSYVTDGTEPRSSFAPSPYEVGAASSKTMTAARLQVGGVAPAYPSLIDTMGRLLEANYRMSVKEAAAEDADLLWVNVAGTGPLSGESAGRILSALKAGKFVLADVVSGNPDWAEEFEGNLKKLDSKIRLEKMLRADPIFTGAIPGTRGFDVTRVHLRKALQTRFGDTGRCDLFTILWDGRPAGVFSAHDLSSGIGYNYFPDCRGPLPDDSRKVVMNTFLSAYGRKVGVTTAER